MKACALSDSALMLIVYVGQVSWLGRIFLQAPILCANWQMAAEL